MLVDGAWLSSNAKRQCGFQVSLEQMGSWPKRAAYLSANVFSQHMSRNPRGRLGCQHALLVQASPGSKSTLLLQTFRAEQRQRLSLLEVTTGTVPPAPSASLLQPRCVAWGMQPVEGTVEGTSPLLHGHLERCRARIL